MGWEAMPTHAEGCKAREKSKTGQRMNNMTQEQEEAKKLLPIIQAYVEGKKIQVKLKTDSKALTENWVDVTNPDWNMTRCYRIKPEPTYRHPYRVSV